MHTKKSTFYLFAIIVLEGYAVLATELLAIRLNIPFTGSGTETVSVIIAAVLMPLALGYYAGGRFRPSGRRSIRRKLMFNLLLALAILIPGLSYVLLVELYQLANRVGLSHRLVQITLYSGIFLVVPVYLLGQTIPLVSNYFGRRRLADITGRILFFSTVGSFLGAVLSSLVLMAVIGVNYTAVVVFVILAALTVLISKRKLSGFTVTALALAIVGTVINSNAFVRRYDIVEMNRYNVIAVKERNDGRHLYLNNDPSSKYSESGLRYPYVELLEAFAIRPVLQADPPKEILVVGAGAFTFGHHDRHNRYDYVDIDGSLKGIAQEKILKQDIGENKTFHPLPARAFLAQSDKRYDMILLDAYFGRFTIPEHLITREFFLQVKRHLKPNGVVVANIVASPNFANAFSRNIDSTFRSVFPHVSRHVIFRRYMPWNDDPARFSGTLYIYRDHPDAEPGTIYSDTKNRSFLDRQ